MRKHIYLACPYRTASQEELNKRMELFAEAARQIRAKGDFVTSPVFHHWTFNSAEASDGDYWLAYSKDVLESLQHASKNEVEMWLLTFPGWESSSGVALELSIAKERDIPVRYVNFDSAGKLEHIN